MTSIMSHVSLPGQDGLLIRENRSSKVLPGLLPRNWLAQGLR